MTDFTAYEPLIEEYATWCAAQGLPQLSADELHAELQALDPDTDTARTQRAWLLDFIQRWDAI